MVHLRLLGGASIEGDGGLLTGPVAQRHRLALLALLAAAGPGGLRRERLLAYLWPQKDARRAGGLLRQAVHYVRKAAGARALESSVGVLVLDPDALPSDLYHFREAMRGRRWRVAVDHYQGPFLDGFRLPGAREFNRWVDGRRRHLANRYRRGLEALAESGEARGDGSEAVRWWTRRAAADPLNSRVVRRLAEALVAAGNPPGALAQLRQYRERLRDELGVPLPRDLEALAEALARPGHAGFPGGG
jgi:DNA-binding SARP family transcriptional activator